MNRLASSLLIVVVALCGTQLWAGNRARTVVVPALYPMVQLGADVSILTGATLLTYEPVAVANGEFPLVHRLVPRSLSWERVGADVFSFGHYAQVQSIDEIIIVGSDAMVPAALIEQAPSPRVRRIRSIQPSEVANALHETMSFSRSQWRKLSSRNDFMIDDRNEERRRFGRYGRPGAQAAAPQPTVEPLAPVALVTVVETSVVETVEPVTVSSDPILIVDAPVVESAPAMVEIVPPAEEISPVVVEVPVEVVVPVVEEVPVEVVVSVVEEVPAMPALEEKGALPVPTLEEKGALPVPTLSAIEEAAQAVPTLAPQVEVKQ